MLTHMVRGFLWSFQPSPNADGSEIGKSGVSGGSSKGLLRSGAGMTDVGDALGNIHLFRGIQPAGLRRLGAVARHESYGQGHIIFREGDTGGQLYLIMDGRIRISREVSGMGEEALAILGPGEAFGEMSIIDDFPRSADARVHERCRLLVLERESVEELLFLDKELAYEILWNVVKILSSRLRETNDKMTFLSVSGKF